jgi:hypothetical protein
MHSRREAAGGKTGWVRLRLVGEGAAGPAGTARFARPGWPEEGMQAYFVAFLFRSGAARAAQWAEKGAAQCRKCGKKWGERWAFYMRMGERMGAQRPKAGTVSGRAAGRGATTGNGQSRWQARGGSDK